MLAYSQEIANRLIDSMEADNGCCFFRDSKNLQLLTEAVDKMSSSGQIEWADDDLFDITSGEISEVQEKYGSIDGYRELDEVLNCIFDNPLVE